MYSRFFPLKSANFGDFDPWGNGGNLSSSDPGGVMNIVDPMTGTFVFIKLGYLKNFMSNECSMKCLWASENQRNWIFDIIY